MFTSLVQNTLKIYCNSWIQAQSRSLLPYVLSFSGVSSGWQGLSPSCTLCLPGTPRSQQQQGKEEQYWQRITSAESFIAFTGRDKESWENQLARGESTSEMSKTNCRLINWRFSLNSAKFRKRTIWIPKTLLGVVFYLTGLRALRGCRRIITKAFPWVCLAEAAVLLLPSFCQVILTTKVLKILLM